MHITKKKYRYITVVVTIIVVVLMLQSVNCEEIITVIEIYDHGVVEAFIRLFLDEGVHEITAPVEPIVSTVTAQANNSYIPVIYANGSFYFVLNNKSEVVIDYVANVSIDRNIFYLNILTENNFEIRLSKNIILLSWPEEKLIDARIEQDKLILVVKGPLVIRYTLRTSPTPTLSQSPTSTPVTQTPIPSTLPQSNETQRQDFSNIMILVVVIIVLAIGGLGYYFYISKVKNRRSSITEILNDIDIAIIKALEARGGTALQTELQNDVTIPRTTLWRHVKKLEKLGIVKVEKVGLQNKIILIKKIKI